MQGRLEERRHVYQIHGPVTIPRLTHIPASILAVLTIRDYGTGIFLYGAVIVLQGPQRWSGPQFVTSLEVASSTIWGILFALCGALTLVGHFRYWFLMRNAGLYGAAVMVLMLGLTTFREATRNPDVSFAGAVFCGMVAVAILIVARAKEELADDGLPQDS